MLGPRWLNKVNITVTRVALGQQWTDSNRITVGWVALNQRWSNSIRITVGGDILGQRRATVVTPTPTVSQPCQQFSNVEPSKCCHMRNTEQTILLTTWKTRSASKLKTESTWLTWYLGNKVFSTPLILFSLKKDAHNFWPTPTPPASTITSKGYWNKNYNSSTKS